MNIPDMNDFMKQMDAFMKRVDLTLDGVAAEAARVAKCSENNHFGGLERVTKDGSVMQCKHCRMTVEKKPPVPEVPRGPGAQRM